MGDRLGGKPEGTVGDYDVIRASDTFQRAIADLEMLSGEQRIAIMCSEGDHRRCHRYKLITPALEDFDVHVLHIQTDGTLVDEENEPRQLSLF